MAVDGVDSPVSLTSKVTPFLDNVDYYKDDDQKLVTRHLVSMKTAE